jgi:hypothetical protein
VIFAAHVTLPIRPPASRQPMSLTFALPPQFPMASFTQSARRFESLLLRPWESRGAETPPAPFDSKLQCQVGRFLTAVSQTEDARAPELKRRVTRDNNEIFTPNPFVKREACPFEIRTYLTFK